ncbi:helix-turn-helix domain-containing protein [uncultured Nocardioides sp.]|uniref:helix-turn-helix domain-containing protein n=1 Tax=uncultured Nocardioides sp. TaxID=198441 RepID=UPI0032B1C7D8
MEVRRNTLLTASTGIVAGVVAAAYLTRAASGGTALDWVLALVLALIALVHAQGVLDARAPLFVADELGVRLRTGKEWRGLPWTEIQAVEVLPRRRFLRDGSIDVLSGEDPIQVPLSLSTRVTGLTDGDVVDALAALAQDRCEVAEIDGYTYVSDEEWHEDDHDGDYDEDSHDDHGDHHGGSPAYDEHEVPGSRSAEHEPAPERVHAGLRPMLAHAIDSVARFLPERGGATAVPTAQVAQSGPLGAPAMTASATPSALREPVTAVRAEIRSDLTMTQPIIGATALRLDADHDETDDADRPELPEARELRRPGSVDLVEDTEVWGDRVRPIAREGHAVEPIVLPEEEQPAPDPVIGPELAAARTRLGLTVDQLADRTRIRPHVIEAVEVDDFSPCGGDFYARGHLRTLARVLGIDAAPLVASYDERYADAPVTPRRVFEAELGQGGALRGTRGGPNWSVLVAAVMALVLAWSVARLVTDSPVEVRDPLPSLTTTSGTTATGTKVPVVLTAAGGGAEVVVRDGANELVYKGTLAFGQVKVLPKVSQPVRVQSSDGSVQVSVGGVDHGALGATGRQAQDTFVAE